MKNEFNKYSDRELILIIRDQGKNTQNAFVELYDRYSSRVYAYCRKVMPTREGAEDLYQETFFRFYNKVVTDYEIVNIIGYLITIARNLCLNYQRDKRTFLSIEDINPSDEYKSLSARDDDGNIEEQSQMVLMALDLLDPSDKEALLMKYYANMSYNEIAEVSGQSANAMRVKIHRAKDKIRSLLTRDEKKTINK
jgi:RNA polymerase sigma factor (sigma-70 family)